MPDHKTLADLRHENGACICNVSEQFVGLCRRIGTMIGDCVAIDDNKFKALNNSDKNLTKGKTASRIAHLKADLDGCINDVVHIDRREEGEARAKKGHIFPVAMAASCRSSSG